MIAVSNSIFLAQIPRSAQHGHQAHGAQGISMVDGENEYLNLKQAWCSESNNPSMFAHDNTEINLRDAALAATSLHLQQM
jgi:hypothetical protein